MAEEPLPAAAELTVWLIYSY